MDGCTTHWWYVSWGGQLQCINWVLAWRWGWENQDRGGFGWAIFHLEGDEKKVWPNVLSGRGVQGCSPCMTPVPLKYWLLLFYRHPTSKPSIVTFTSEMEGSKMRARTPSLSIPEEWSVMGKDPRPGLTLLPKWPEAEKQAVLWELAPVTGPVACQCCGI